MDPNPIGDGATTAWTGGLLAVILAPTAPAKDAILASLVPPADGATWPMPDLPTRPGRDPSIREVADPPRRRSGVANLGSRRRFLHAIWHIELSAVDLACLLALRGSGMPRDFHVEVLGIARDEALHADLVEGWLHANAFPPGSDPVHHRLWDSALGCADAGEQIVVVPRYLEARGLDVSAELLPRLATIDGAAHAVVERIYHDEIRHVEIGTRWHRRWCAAHGKDSEAHFAEVVRRRFASQLPSPFALDAAGRGAAGFTRGELDVLVGEAAAEAGLDCHRPGGTSP